MIYFANLKQVSEGCDYPIGCGSRLMLLRATDKKAALEEVKLAVTNDFKDERAIQYVTLIEVNEAQTMDASEWYKQEQVKIQPQEEKLERELLAKLKAKYEV